MTSKQNETGFAERRSVPRFSPNPATSCHVRSAPAGDPRPATIQNISSNGINLVMQHPVEVGASLLVTLMNKRGPLLERIVAVRVCRVAEQPDGNYALGCAFQTQLTGHELLSLAL